MLLLALDTSTPAVTAGIASLDATSGAVDVLAEQVTVDARAHGELLTPQLTEAARMAGIKLRELDAVVCGAGPGPFTGLRVGMVTAAALGHGLGLPAYPVCGLDAIAAEATGEPLLVVTDARRREVYWARYDAKGVRVAGPAVSAPLDVPVADAVRVAGHGAQVYPDAFDLPVVAPSYPTPCGLVRVAAAAIAAGAEPEPLTPQYLRRPDAQEPGERKRVRQ
ncbi:MAG: tRNA (adenosine(37)-N6)-threonylcarbamoyltransferase complex dimerization subunit type 1 TsaB [Actinophytocola sp.]|nr:tRNA (adenosine(37)-N6)-threonylcarbamoyltransferase complex dimerization subunit type 1 TsaB [Actinophytocola sp.]